jgi:hypothetical protein
MRALALALIIAVPAMSFAQQKVELTPCVEQAVTQHTLLPPDAPPSLFVAPWYVWTIAGVSVAAVVAAAVAWVAFGSTPTFLPHKQADFGPGITGWLNKPPT